MTTFMQNFLAMLAAVAGVIVLIIAVFSIMSGSLTPMIILGVISIALFALAATIRPRG